MFKLNVYTSLNAHIFGICKYNLFKFSVVGLSFCVKILLLTFIAIRSLLSDLGPYQIICSNIIFHLSIHAKFLLSSIFTQQFGTITAITLKIFKRLFMIFYAALWLKWNQKWSILLNVLSKSLVHTDETNCYDTALAVLFREVTPSKTIE